MSNNYQLPAKIVQEGEVLHPPVITIELGRCVVLKRQLDEAQERIRRFREGVARPVLPWEHLDDGAIDG